MAPPPPTLYDQLHLLFTRYYGSCTESVGKAFDLELFCFYPTGEQTRLFLVKDAERAADGLSPSKFALRENPDLDSWEFIDFDDYDTEERSIQVVAEVMDELLGRHLYDELERLLGNNFEFDEECITFLSNTNEDTPAQQATVCEKGLLMATLLVAEEDRLFPLSLEVCNGDYCASVDFPPSGTSPWEAEQLVSQLIPPTLTTEELLQNLLHAEFNGNCFLHSAGCFTDLADSFECSEVGRHAELEMSKEDRVESLTVCVMADTQQCDCQTKDLGMEGQDAYVDALDLLLATRFE